MLCLAYTASTSPQAKGFALLDTDETTLVRPDTLKWAQRAAGCVVEALRLAVDERAPGSLRSCIFRPALPFRTVLLDTFCLLSFKAFLWNSLWCKVVPVTSWMFRKEHLNIRYYLNLHIMF